MNRKDQYEIIGLIGQGAFGQVYKGRRKGTSQVVALKTIKKKSKSEKDLNNIRQEIQILKKLKHQNVVLMIDHFETSSEFVMVTELGHAELYTLIEDDKTLPQAEIRKVARQLVHALNYLHSHRIAHRDMKPQNILICARGTVKLCDFGFARNMSYKTQVLTSLKGTPLYMAPEVLQEKPYNHTADLWSLGVILFELFAGTPPFMSHHIYSLVERIVKDPIKYPEGMSNDFKAFLKGLLNKNPAERLAWPDLLHHPFIKESEQELQLRIKHTQKYNKWVSQVVQEDFQKKHVLRNTFTATGMTHLKISPAKEKRLCGDQLWNKYQSLSQEERTATNLRTDPKFFQKVIALLGTSMTDLLRDKSKKAILMVALRCLCYVVIKSRKPEGSKDLIKEPSFLSQLMNLLKSLIKIENGKNFIEILTELIKTIGLTARATLEKGAGLDVVFLRSCVPHLTTLTKIALAGEAHPELALNIIKAVGNMLFNCTTSIVKSYSLFKQLLDTRFIQEVINCLRRFEEYEIKKCTIQMLAFLVHPPFGQISTFPWRRSMSSLVSQFNYCYPIIESLKLALANTLLQFDWAGTLNKVYMTQDDIPIQVRCGILRLLLQACRASKQFSEKLLGQKFIIKILIQNLRQENATLFGLSAILIHNLFPLIKGKQLFNEISTISAQLQPRILKDKCNPLIQIYGLSLISEFSPDSLVKIQVGTLFKIVSDLLNNRKLNKFEQISRIQGSNFGVLAYGFNDFLVTVLIKFIQKTDKHPRKLAEIGKALSDSELDQALLKIMNQLNSRNDLSPRGMIAFLMLALQLSINEVANFSGRLLRGQSLNNLVQMLSQSQVLAVQEWPGEMYGGGQICIHLLTVNLLKLYNVGLQLTQPDLNVYYQKELVFLVLNAIKNLQREQINLAVTLFSRFLALSDDTRPFHDQFLAENGITLFSTYELITPETPIFLLLQSLALLSNLARISPSHYPVIDTLPLSNLRKLLNHSQASVRAKVCNLLGNMCKHNQFFYDKIQKLSIPKEIVNACGDSDSNVRKFACFALGNMAFHSSRLYDQLRLAIPKLVPLLGDAEEKTRSNSAGALGNMVRNSNILAKQIMKSGTLAKLKTIIQADRSLAVVKVAYISLATLSSNQECGRAICQLGLQDLMRRHLVTFQKQSHVVKSILRLQERMKE